jgi:hypothetical protein
MDVAFERRSVCERRTLAAHNLKAAGSNPAPATPLKDDSTNRIVEVLNDE